MPAGARQDYLYQTAQVPGAPTPELADPGFAISANALGAQGQAAFGVRDGTPARIAGVLILSAATIAALRIAGFRFNVGVSG